MLEMLVTLLLVATAYSIGDARLRSLRQLRALFSPLARLLDPYSATATVGCKRDVEGLRQHKEELTSTVSAIQPQPATLPSGHYPQHGPQPDEDPDMSCVIVLKHRLEDIEEADSRNCKCTCSPETQPKEANDQSFVNAEQARLEGLLKESTEKNSKQCERICTLKTEQALLQGLLDESVEENSKLFQHIRTLEAKLKEANEAKDSSCTRLNEIQSAEQLVAAITEEQKLHDVSKRQVADLQGQLTGSQREKADVEHQLQEAQHARHQLEHGALRQNQIGAVPSGCACGMARCPQQALNLHQSLRTSLLKNVKTYFRITGADEIGRYLNRAMAAEHGGVEATVWELLLQLFRQGKNFCNSVSKHDDEANKQIRLVTKEWLIRVTGMSDLYASQAMDQLLNSQYTAQEFISKLHEAKYRITASSAPAPVADAPQPARLFAPPSPESYTSSGVTGWAHETNSSAASSSSYQRLTPPGTSRSRPQFLSKDGTEGINSNGDKVHMDRHGNWTLSTHAHLARNGPYNEPAYIAADGRTGRGSHMKPMTKRCTGTWKYDD